MCRGFIVSQEPTQGHRHHIVPNFWPSSGPAVPPPLLAEIRIDFIVSKTGFSPMHVVDTALLLAGGRHD
jgi:hypothetical protein